jgi:hypothetical protein
MHFTTLFLRIFTIKLNLYSLQHKLNYSKDNLNSKFNLIFKLRELFITLGIYIMKSYNFIRLLKREISFLPTLSNKTLQSEKFLY